MLQKMIKCIMFLLDHYPERNVSPFRIFKIPKTINAEVCPGNQSFLFPPSVAIIMGLRDEIILFIMSLHV